MGEDLTPQVITLQDSQRLKPGNIGQHVTRLSFMLGRFGPFEHEWDHKPERYEIDAVIAARRAQLEGLV